MKKQIIKNKNQEAKAAAERKKWKLIRPTARSSTKKKKILVMPSFNNVD